MQPKVDARTLSGAALGRALREARARAWTFDLSNAQWRVPQVAGVNLPAWGLVHIVWFGEFWVLREPHTVRRLPTAAECGHAARTQPGFDWGDGVWEWTTSNFQPYLAFEPAVTRLLRAVVR